MEVHGERLGEGSTLQHAVAIVTGGSSGIGRATALGLAALGARVLVTGRRAQPLEAALEHLTRCWALELAPLGVRVNAVAAGPTESGALTGMMGLSREEAAALEREEARRGPLGRRGVPAEVARWIVQLTDPRSAWVTGQVLTIDGGLEVA